MSEEAVPRWRAALSTRSLDDAQRGTTLAGIQKVAPQSALMQVPAVAASVASLGTKGTALAADVSAVAAAQQALKASVTQRGTARGAFDNELVALKALVENNATSGSDITGMGFTLLVAAKASQAPPDAPAALIVKIGKAHGKASVSVQGKGDLGNFAAEVSADPVGPATWSALPGTGKQRKLAGYASGTKLWVRFAAVRFGMQSDWCTPVLVTIP